MLPSHDKDVPKSGRNTIAYVTRAQPGVLLTKVIDLIYETITRIRLAGGFSYTLPHGVDIGINLLTVLRQVILAAYPLFVIWVVCLIV